MLLCCVECCMLVLWGKKTLLDFFEIHTPTQVCIEGRLKGKLVWIAQFSLFESFHSLLIVTLCHLLENELDSKEIYWRNLIFFTVTLPPLLLVSRSRLKELRAVCFSSAVFNSSSCRDFYSEPTLHGCHGSAKLSRGEEWQMSLRTHCNGLIFPRLSRVFRRFNVGNSTLPFWLDDEKCRKALQLARVLNFLLFYDDDLQYIFSVPWSNHTLRSA